MKKLQLTLKGGINDPIIENLIQKKDKELKELARKNGAHFAKRDQPNAVGDQLLPYTGEIKTGYEKLATEILQHLQPGVHFPEAKIDADYLKEKDGNLDDKINELQMQNQNDEYELTGFNPSHVSNKMWWAILITAIIMLGEVIFNSKAFQITGDNLIFSMIISISISVAVYVFAHFATLLYKEAKTKFYRWLVVAGSLLLTLIIFTALAIFRSRYLAAHDVKIHPAFFVAINVFFFIVSALISYFIMPSWNELKQNSKLLKRYKLIQKRKKEINRLINDKSDIRSHVRDSTKGRLRVTHHAKYVLDRIRKMYHESLEVFKTTNLTFRTDRKVPDCFLQVPPVFDVEEDSFNLLKTPRK